MGISGDDMALAGFLTAIFSALALGYLCLVLGPRIGIVDRPFDDGLKVHTLPAVPLGGVAVMVGLHLGMVVGGVFDGGLLVVTALIWLLGVADDVLGLSPILRLLGTAAVGVALALLGVSGDGFVGGLFAVGLVIVLVNAINLFDGIDALAGSVSALAAFGLASFAFNQGIGKAWMFALLAAALIGFLFWNLPRARLFLGDNGAYVVGVVLAWAVLRASFDWTGRAVAVGLIGLPLLDLGITVVRRVAVRAKLFAGDRDHIYDRLVKRGWSVPRVVSTAALAQLGWVAALIEVSNRFGDLPAAVTGLALGVIALVVLGVWLPRRARAVPGWR